MSLIPVRINDDVDVNWMSLAATNPRMKAELPAPLPAPTPSLVEATFLPSTEAEILSSAASIVPSATVAAVPPIPLPLPILLPPPAVNLLVVDEGAGGGAGAGACAGSGADAGADGVTSGSAGIHLPVSANPATTEAIVVHAPVLNSTPNLTPHLTLPVPISSISTCLPRTTVSSALVSKAPPRAHSAAPTHFYARSRAKNPAERLAHILGLTAASARYAKVKAAANANAPAAEPAAAAAAAAPLTLRMFNTGKPRDPLEFVCPYSHYTKSSSKTPENANSALDCFSEKSEKSDKFIKTAFERRVPGDVIEIDGPAAAAARAAWECDVILRAVTAERRAAALATVTGAPIRAAAAVAASAALIAAVRDAADGAVAALTPAVAATLLARRALSARALLRIVVGSSRFVRGGGGIEGSEVGTPSGSGSGSGIGIGTGIGSTLSASAASGVAPAPLIAASTAGHGTRGAAAAAYAFTSSHSALPPTNAHAEQGALLRADAAIAGLVTVRAPGGGGGYSSLVEMPVVFHCPPVFPPAFRVQFF